MPANSCHAALALSIIIILLTGCSSSPMSDPWPEPRPLGTDYQAYRPPPSPELVESPRPFEEPAGTLSLRDALAATLLASPDLVATAFEVRAGEAEAIQAGLLPNPDLELEIENFGGTGELGGTGASEMTLALGQLIELGGDRLARRRVARRQAEAAGWAYEVRRIDVLSRTAADFITLLAAGRRLEVAQGREDLARRVDTVVGDRVEAGKVSPVERTKAEVELAQAQLDRERAALRVAASRVRLAANWGSVEPRFDRLAGDLDRTPAPPPLDAMLAHVDRTPDLARWAAEAARRQAEIELAMARSVPDLTVNAGVRYHDEIDETAFVAGLSLPLPLLDRNQGDIEAARWRALQARELTAASRLRIRTALAEAHADLEAAFLAVRATRDRILPAAELAFTAAEEAFRQGKIGALDLLDAERTLFGARRQLADALTSYHLAVVAAERLTGAPLHGGDQIEGDLR